MKAIEQGMGDLITMYLWVVVGGCEKTSPLFSNPPCSQGQIHVRDERICFLGRVLGMLPSPWSAPVPPETAIHSRKIERCRERCEKYSRNPEFQSIHDMYDMVERRREVMGV
jgi:hypothetical protein